MSNHKCPYCSSTNLRKEGMRSGKRRYSCNNCGKWSAFKELPEFLKRRILLFDIETAPSIVAAWGRWNQNFSQDHVISEGYTLCYSAKWLDEEEIHFDALPFYKEFEDDVENDYNVVKSLWELLDNSDIVIGHNAQFFDVPFMNSRFAFHHLPPPSPYRVIDTLRIAKKHFRFPSNKLDDLGEYLGLGRKIKHDGMRMWRGCMDGDMDYWDKMIEYNQQDVNLLEKVYLSLRAWDKQHPNVAVFDIENKVRCCVCGSEDLKMGQDVYTNLSRFTLLTCNNCGHANRTRTTHFSKEKRDTLLGNVVS